MIGVECILLVLITGLCLLHWWWFKHNLYVGPLFHFLFGAAYFIPAFTIAWLWQHSWVLILAVTVERFVFYSPLLNLMRDKPFFYLSVSGKNPSWFDRILIPVYKYYPVIWTVITAGFITLQFLL